MSIDSVYVVELKGLIFKCGLWVIFDNIDVCILCGKVIGIMGLFGCGKIMLLWLIVFQLCFLKGEVWVNGQNLLQFLCGDLFDMCKQFGVLFQSGVLFIDFDVFENVVFLLCVYIQLLEEMICDIVLMKFQVVGLCGVVELMLDEFFGGMKCCVVLVWVIVLDLQILFYDELFVGQDLIVMGVLVCLICLFNDVFGIISIVVFYDLVEIVSIVDYIYIVGDGWVFGYGMLDVFKEIDDFCICQFVKGILDGFVLFYYLVCDYWVDLLGEC